MNKETLLEKLDQVEKLIADIRTLCADVNPSEGEVINPAKDVDLPVGTRFLYKGLHLVVASAPTPGMCDGCAFCRGLEDEWERECVSSPSCAGKVFVEAH